MSPNSRNSKIGRSPSNSGKSSWIKRILVIGLISFVALVALAPTLLSNASLANWAIANYAGLQPLNAEVSGLQLGWFKSVSVSGINVSDESGQSIAKVGSVQTNKSLLNWITNSSDLGHIKIDGVEANIVADHGTTNVEQILEQLSKASSNDPKPAPDQTATLPTGAIELTNTKVVVSQAGRPERWLVDVPTANVQLPTGNQLIGPVELTARITEASSGANAAGGEIIAHAEQSDDGNIQIRAKLSDLPLQIFHVVKARLPDLPIENTAGVVSGTLAGAAASFDAFAFDLQQLQIRDLAVDAPDYVGPTPARLANISAAARVTLAGTTLRVQDSLIDCDFGKVQANAELPWPLTIPSLTQPYFENGSVSAAGFIEIPKLVTAAQSLVPMRDDSQLQSGQMQFSISQTKDGVAQAKAVLSGLQAIAGGQSISWREPLTLEANVAPQSNGPQFGLAVLAEFCNIRGQGSIERGALDGNVDLSLLHQRLSQFVQLPLSSMSGQAQLKGDWNIDNNQLVTAVGTLVTSPAIFVTPTGGQMQEPAWQGSFNAKLQLNNGTPERVQAAHLEMVATDEKLNVDLHEPLSLIAAGDIATPPAAFSVSAAGHLANWKNRALVWLAEPPEMDIEGVFNLSVNGKLDTSHVEIQQGNFDAQPLRFQMSGFAFAEPQVVGKFEGNVNTNDMTALRIEQLTIQSSSFSVLAKDQAAEQNSRSGQASMYVNLQKLLKNVGSAPGATSTPPATSYAATGEVQAGLRWIVNANGAEFRAQMNGKDVVLTSVAPGTMSPTALWSEPQLVIACDGKWRSENNAIDIAPLQLQAPWINYQGTLSYLATDMAQDVKLDGQAVYDAAQLSQKIAPMTGNNLQLAGQHTMPIQAAWHRDAADTTSPALAGLQAQSRIGWEQARVIGIEVGKADVPVNISAGKLTTAAEIPVSGGMLRWDIFSDLTQDLMVIEQKPMVILENVAITREMCSGWLKYVAPMVAEATSIDGQLSLAIEQAYLTPTDLTKQTVSGQLVMHKAEVGPGPLSNEVIGLIKQFEQIRKPDLTQAVSSQNKVWLHLPEQKISFTMADGRVNHRDVRVDVGDATITTSGSVDVAGQLEMLAVMPIPDKWTEKGPILTALRGQSLQFPVRGNISRPQLDSSVLRQLGRQTIQNATQNLLQQQLNKGLEKFLK